MADKPSEIISLSFTNKQPMLLLVPTSPSQAPIEFVQVLAGRDGEDVATDNLDGFTTEPLAYYILAST